MDPQSHIHSVAFCQTVPAEALQRFALGFWLEVLALGSWFLLCGLDFAAAAWSDLTSPEDVRWWSHGLGLTVLAAAALALLVSQRCLPPGAFKGRPPEPAMTAAVPSAPAKLDKQASEQLAREAAAQRARAQNCCAVAVHGTLVGGGACWLVLQAAARREPQVWMGASTLYALASLAAAHCALRAPARGGCAAATRRAWGSFGKAETLSQRNSSTRSARGPSVSSPVRLPSRIDTSNSSISKPWYRRGSHTSLPVSYVSEASTPPAASQGSPGSRWKPLFRDPTFGELGPARRRSSSELDTMMPGQSSGEGVRPSVSLPGILPHLEEVMLPEVSVHSPYSALPVALRSLEKAPATKTRAASPAAPEAQAKAPATKTRAASPAAPEAQAKATPPAAACPPLPRAGEATDAEEAAQPSTSCPVPPEAHPAAAVREEGAKDFSMTGEQQDTPSLPGPPEAAQTPERREPERIPTHSSSSALSDVSRATNELIQRLSDEPTRGASSCPLSERLKPEPMRVQATLSGQSTNLQDGTSSAPLPASVSADSRRSPERADTESSALTDVSQATTALMKQLGGAGEPR